MPRCLITAGNTREMIDRVRDWGNIFTGNTGFSIAQALRPLADVELLTSNTDHIEKATAIGIRADAFRSHDDLMLLLATRMSTGTYDAVFMTAAVADYAPAGVFAVQKRSVLADGTEQWIVRNAQAEKVKSNHPAIAVLGARTTKIVDQFRSQWQHRGLLIKFKLEVGLTDAELLAVAETSRRASGADYIVANTLAMVAGERAGGYLLSDGHHEWVPRHLLAQRCAAIVATRAIGP